MWKRFALPFATVALAFAFVLAPSANAAPQRNAGDTWVDVPGHLADPGHENDPHICGLVDIYGNGLADPTGTFEGAPWPPPGDGSTGVASGTWKYDQSIGGNQVIAGPLSLQPGHYKLTVSQDP